MELGTAIYLPIFFFLIDMMSYFILYAFWPVSDFLQEYRNEKY